jgi:DNA-binding MarR family transcriptional regulator
MHINARIGRALSTVHRMTQTHISRQLEPFALGSGQFPFFMAIMRNEGATQEDISARLRMDKATTAKALHKLVDAGYVAKERDPEDGRVWRIRFTEKGHALTPAVLGCLRGWSEIMYTGFTVKEKKVFTDMLERIVRNIDAQGEMKP